MAMAAALGVVTKRNSIGKFSSCTHSAVHLVTTLSAAGKKRKPTTHLNWYIWV